MEQKTIIRTPKGDHPYFSLSRALAQDERLSYEAKGLLVELLSRPPNWEVQPEQLARPGCKRDKVYRILAELHKLGYLTREKHQDASGRWMWEPYRIYECPLPENPDTVGPYPEKPYTENTDMVGSGTLALPDALKPDPSPYPDLPYTEKPEIIKNREYTDQRTDERESSGAKQAINTPQAPSNRQSLLAAAAKMCGMIGTLTEKQFSTLNGVVESIEKVGATPAQVADFERYWFSEYNGLYAKRGARISRPHPSQLQEHWGLYLAMLEAEARPEPKKPAPPRPIYAQPAPRRAAPAPAAAPAELANIFQKHRQDHLK